MARTPIIDHFADAVSRSPVTGAISNSDAPIAMMISGSRKMTSFQLIGLLRLRYVLRLRRRGWRRINQRLTIEIRGIDFFHDVVDRLLERIEERFRINADPDHDRHEREHQPHLAAVDVRHVVILRIVERAPEDALIEPEQIRGAEDDADGGEDRPPDVPVCGADENRELAD